MAKKFRISPFKFDNDKLKVNVILSEVIYNRLAVEDDRLKKAFKTVDAFTQYDFVSIKSSSHYLDDNLGIKGGINIYSCKYFPPAKEADIRDIKYDPLNWSNGPWCNKNIAATKLEVKPTKLLNFNRAVDKAMHVEDRLDFLWEKEYPWIVKSNSPVRGSFTTERISSINEDLRHLKQNWRLKPTAEILEKIKSLVRELHNIISSYFTQQRKFVKQLRIKFSAAIIRDIRQRFRQTIHLIFKNLPDFSGCEEEAKKFTSYVNFNKFLSFHKQHNNVQYDITCPGFRFGYSICKI